MARPSAFRRPSIDLDRHRRSWGIVRADHLVVGDTVAGHGTVEAISGSGPSRNLSFPSGQCVLPSDTELLAFQVVQD